MKLISLLSGCLLLVQLAAGKPAAAQSSPAQAAEKPAAAASDSTTVRTSEGDVQVNLPPGTKSVLKRPAEEGSQTIRAGYEGAAMVPVPSAKTIDPAVRQASGSSSNTVTGSTASAASGGAKAAADVSDAAQAAAVAAADLMTQALTAPKDSTFAGRPTTLLELMARAGGDRNRQLWVVRGYWKLSAAQADCNWAADELARLDQTSAAKGLEASILSAAQAAAQARLHEARVGAVAAQQELADLLGIVGNAQLPLAADSPLLGPYRTYFDTLFAARVPPPRTRAIDRQLPIRLEAIQARTEAVHTALSAAHYAEESRAKGQADLQTLLTCHAELARERRAFLATVRDYNLDIGEYSLAVADPSITNERLVAMMILVKAPTPLAAAGQNEPTLARTPNDAALLQPALPADSVDAATKNGVRPAGGAGDRQGK